MVDHGTGGLCAAKGMLKPLSHRHHALQPSSIALRCLAFQLAATSASWTSADTREGAEGAGSRGRRVPTTRSVPHADVSSLSPPCTVAHFSVGDNATKQSRKERRERQEQRAQRRRRMRIEGGGRREDNGRRCERWRKKGTTKEATHPLPQRRTDMNATHKGHRHSRLSQ
mgnify:FL=1